jgi:hypothetical protein
VALKYGLKPVDEQPRVKLRDYYTSGIPTVDSLTFPLGHASLIQPHMFCNDTIGDCAIAGSIEEVRLANALRGVTVNFTDQTAIQNYSDITGYNPDDPSSDQGTDVHALYQYRKTTGLVDADGKRHTVVAYAGLTQGDWDELLVALSLFDMVGIGIQVPDYAQNQFSAGQPWDVEPGQPNIEGGHYIPVVSAASNTLADVFTWGALQGMTEAFYRAFNIVAVVGLTAEMFNGDKGPDGIDFDRLQADLPEFNTGTVSAKAPKHEADTVNDDELGKWADDGAKPVD